MDNFLDFDSINKLSNLLATDTNCDATDSDSSTEYSSMSHYNPGDIANKKIHKSTKIELQKT
ncbi:hypothetical protein A3Q56_08246 [Intoshia linei]|uniref:Uncharacterized protein n=1 Tax=Intoshia linei TaxID=1819745 RepID=A0A177APH3_9BILA|nr:hypothetical protein A3Q56_08246 [Intoshia linei]